jgi:hypothetical protein
MKSGALLKTNYHDLVDCSFKYGFLLHPVKWTVFRRRIQYKADDSNMQNESDKINNSNDKPPFNAKKLLLLFFVLVFIFSLGYAGYSFIDTLKPDNKISNPQMGDSDEEILAEDVDIKDVDDEIKKIEQELQKLE